MKILATDKRFLEIPGKHTELLRIAGHVLPTEKFKFPMDEKDICKAAQDVAGIIVGSDSITARIILSASRLKVISCLGSSVENVDVAAATKSKVTVTFAPDRSYESAAELVIALMLALARKIPQHNMQCHTGEWLPIEGAELEGKVMGLLGFDTTAKEAAKRAQGFGMKVAAYDVIRDKDFADCNNIRLLDADEIIKTADFISIHLPISAETKNFITASRIRNMKPTVFIVNISHSDIVSESDMQKSLKEKWVAGYASDVSNKNSPLAGTDNAILTPGIARNTTDIFMRQARMATENLLRVLAGEKPHAQANTIR